MNIAHYTRVFEVSPTDEFVEKREAAVKDLTQQLIKANDISKAYAFCNALLSAIINNTEVSAPHAELIGAAIAKQSKSFTTEGRHLELGVCGLLAMAEAIKVGGKASERLSIGDVYAVACWSALSFIPPLRKQKLEEMRKELIELSRQRVLQSGLEIRQRRDVPLFAKFGGEATEEEKFVSATKPTIEILRYNAALDREEIEILWWVLGGWSNRLERPLAELAPETRALISGLELGQYMRTLPAQAHRNLVIRGLPAQKKLSLKEVMDAAAADLEPLRDAMRLENVMTASPLSFPVLNTICGYQGDIPGADVKRSLVEWAQRSLLESAMTRIQYAASAAK